MIECKHIKKCVNSFKPKLLSPTSLFSVFKPLTLSSFAQSEKIHLFLTALILLFSAIFGSLRNTIQRTFKILYTCKFFLPHSVVMCKISLLLHPLMTLTAYSQQSNYKLKRRHKHILTADFYDTFTAKTRKEFQDIC